MDTGVWLCEAPSPAGVHAYEYGVEPPLAFAAIVDGTPLHTDGGVAEGATVGLG